MEYHECVISKFHRIVRLFCFELGLIEGAHFHNGARHDWESDPGSQVCEFSTLPLSYPDRSIVYGSWDRHQPYQATVLAPSQMIQTSRQTGFLDALLRVQRDDWIPTRSYYQL